jgi:hypothetical protein
MAMIELRTAELCRHQLSVSMCDLSMADIVEGSEALVFPLNVDTGILWRNHRAKSIVSDERILHHMQI